MNNKTNIIPQGIVSRMQSTESHFVQFLRRLYDAEDVERLAKRYNLGATALGDVTFWQTDAEGNTRTAKVMAYDSTSGHRIKDESGVPFPCSFIHSRLIRRGTLPPDFVAEQCLFGEHLLALPDEADHPVGLVESEKTAIICSGAMPDFVWLATGGKENLNAQRLQPLRSRKVVIFPDADGVEQWRSIVKDAALPFASVNDYARKHGSEKADIADLIIDERMQLPEFGRRANEACKVWEEARKAGKLWTLDPRSRRLLDGATHQIPLRFLVPFIDGHLHRMKGADGRDIYRIAIADLHIYADDMAKAERCILSWLTEQSATGELTTRETFDHFMESRCTRLSAKADPLTFEDYLELVAMKDDLDINVADRILEAERTYIGNEASVAQIVKTYINRPAWLCNCK